MHFTTLNRSGQTLVLSAKGSSSLWITMCNLRAAGEPVRLRSRQKRTLDPPAQNDQIESPLPHCLIPPYHLPRDPDSMSRGFRKEDGSWDLLMDLLTGVNVEDLRASQNSPHNDQRGAQCLHNR